MSDKPMRKGDAPFSVVYDEELDCILAKLEGDLNRPVVSAFFTEVGKVAKVSRCQRVLSDVRDATIAATTFDMYFEARELEMKEILKTFRRAIVISKDKQGYEFWENVSVNLGYQNVKVFEEYDEALKWVKAE